MQPPCLKEATQVCLHNCCLNPLFLSISEPHQTISKSSSTSSTCRCDFVVTTTSSFFQNTQFTNHESLSSLQESYTQFTNAYPQYSSTIPIASSSSSPLPQSSDFLFFGVSYKSVNLKSQLLHGGEGSELESSMRKKIMDFLNISKTIRMVFLPNSHRLSSFLRNHTHSNLVGSF
ncbi:hypothetical protein LOK49_LG06G00369 [Camellia lanceoleosa]|uniref:Uncharacterized protein n=1 Tax=Camellia lanceoleosa TaxID=1840588 RepID=A0ACC0HBB1_9ERIC|nr:hypothetical protein LOK49_LG06G00369 [Camellia lanceoleosa]